MAAHYSLRRLVDSADFTFLQSKLERFSDSYHLNSNDENVNRCCEIIERNAKLQRQLFKLLNDVAAEGGLYSNARTLIRSRFYPYFYEDYYLSSARAAALLASSTTLANDLIVYETLARKNAEIENLTFEYEKNLNNLEYELNETKVDNADLRSELNLTREELYSEKKKSNDDKVVFDCEVSDIRAKLKSAELKILHLEPKAALSDDYERQIILLKDEIRLLRSQNNVLATDNELTKLIIRSRPCSPVFLGRESRARSRSRSVSPVRASLRSLSASKLRHQSPLARDNSTQLIRQENLISRFNEMFARDRLDAMDILRVYSDDYENNQRIVFAAIQEAFSAAKIAFSDWKLKARSTVAITHRGPETLEEAVQEYINRNVDLYDLPSMVTRVTTNLNLNPKIRLPLGVNYSVISSFIRESCRVAWHMACLAYPLDVSFALDAEVLDELKYRRSYDSEFTAPLVNHHIWPCLVQGGAVVAKGEACTRRGAALSSVRPKSILRSRSRSPCRAHFRSYSPSGYYY